MTSTNITKRKSIIGIALGALIMTSLGTGSAEAIFSCTLQCTKNSVKNPKKLNDCARNCNNFKMLDILTPNCKQLDEANKERLKYQLIQKQDPLIQQQNGIEQEITTLSKNYDMNKKSTEERLRQVQGLTIAGDSHQNKYKKELGSITKKHNAELADLYKQYQKQFTVLNKKLEQVRKPKDILQIQINQCGGRPSTETSAPSVTSAPGIPVFSAPKLVLLPKPPPLIVPPSFAPPPPSDVPSAPQRAEASREESQYQVMPAPNNNAALAQTGKTDLKGVPSAAAGAPPPPPPMRRAAPSPLPPKAPPPPPMAAAPSAGSLPVAPAGAPTGRGQLLAQIQGYSQGQLKKSSEETATRPSKPTASPLQGALQDNVDQAMAKRSSSLRDTISPQDQATLDKLLNVDKKTPAQIRAMMEEDWNLFKDSDHVEEALKKIENAAK